MPWCPKCKNEYRKGITVCADCGCELVDEKPSEVVYEKLCVLEKEEIAKKAKDYFEYSNIDCYYEYSEKEQGFLLFVPTNELKQAKKAFQAFYMVEASQVSEESAKEEASVDPFEEDSHPSPSTDLDEEQKAKVASMLYDGGTYEKRADKSKEYKSSAGIFLSFGFAGLVFVLLNYFKVFTILANPLSLIIMTALFVYFIYVGFNSISLHKKASVEAVKEEKMTEEINQFLSETITDDFLSANYDASESAEINFLHITEEMKQLIGAKFGELSASYLDFITEDYYNKNIDHYES